MAKSREASTTATTPVDTQEAETQGRTQDGVNLRPHSIHVVLICLDLPSISAKFRQIYHNMDPYGLVFPVLLLDSPQFVMFFLRVKPGKYTCPMDPMGLRLDCSQDSENYTWRIIPVSKWLVTPIDMPFRPFITRSILLRGLN